MVRCHHQLNGHESEQTPGDKQMPEESCVLRSTGSQRVGYNLATEQQQKSYRVGPKSKDWQQKGDGDVRQTEARACEYGNRNWSDASTGKATPRTANCCQMLGKRHRADFPQGGTCWYQTSRHHNCENKLVLFQTTKLVIICYSSPKETNTMGIQLTNSEKEMVGERENSKGQKSW